MTALPDLVLFAKYPLAGYAKTRLIPALGPDGAARVHRHLTERTIRTLMLCNAPVEIRFAGADQTAFREWLGDHIKLVPQIEGDLSQRLLDASRAHPHIFFGADTPDLSPPIVEQAIHLLEGHDVVIGPAEDGGYYLVAMQTARPQLLTAMPWSTEHVCPETLRRCEAMGLTVAILPELSDCDRPDDLKRWPELANLA